MRQTLRGRYYSYRTEQCYIYWSKQFIFFHDKRHPKDMGAAEIKEYLNHLSLKRRVSASTQNQAFNALLFLFREVLEVDPGKLEGIVRARRPKRIPTVLTMEEVKVLLSAMEGTPQLMARLLYGCGMRLRECVMLRIKDIDWGHSQIIIQDGKGMKSRITLLPESLKEPVREHISRVKFLHHKDLRDGANGVYLPFALERKYPNAGKEWPWFWVFPGRLPSKDPVSGIIRRHHVHPTCLHRAINKANPIGADTETHQLPHSSAFIRDASASEWL